MLWTQDNYRRIFLDIHIDDSQEVYLSKLDPGAIFKVLKDAGAQLICVKGRPHTGLALYPTKYGRTHRGLKGLDYVGEMTKLCHENGIAVMGYFSQIFDNWAYENHPSWRMVNAEGKSSREYENYNDPGLYRRGRYGIVCPNNMEYREYLKNCLTEQCSAYKMESIFLDMPFWPEVCHCASCKDRYYTETGLELPTIVNWDDPQFLDFQARREQWMAEFTAFSNACVKSVSPETTLEQNVGGSPGGLWVGAMTDLIADQCEYVGGDMYGGFLEESFISKYIRNLSNSLPFAYITSRCDPALFYHTTTRSTEEFILYGIIALVHGGAFEICDGINPDGTISPSAYVPVKQAFSVLEKYPQYINGNYESNVEIWLPTFSKFDRSQTGMPIEKACVWARTEYMEAKVAVASILRTENIPYDVLPTKKLGQAKGDLLVISSVAHIRDNEMADIEAYLQKGGKVYLTGRPGHKRFLELLQGEYEGETEHDVTYMAPTAAGQEFFPGFTVDNPYALPCGQTLMQFSGDGKVLATMTLPYTMTGKKEFSSIHSNPPGIATDRVSMIVKKAGGGTILWSAAPIELARSYMSRRVTANIIRSLCGPLKYEAQAPSFVEVMTWEKDGKRYFSVINEQETAPIVPMSGITIRVPYELTQARIIGSAEAVPIRKEDGFSILDVPEVELFHIIEAQ